MNNEEEKKCPLCAEEMDWTDQQLKPCKCGYQVCVWCWHHIMDMAEKDKAEGRCPACRTPYNKDKIVAMEANCERVVATKKEQENKSQKAKPKRNEVKKDLSSVRVIQRKMAYVIGLPLSLADEDLLHRKEYFGQYGKVSKVSLSRTAGGAIQQFINDTCSVYVTYSKEEEAIRCIQSVHGFVLEGRFLRASFGTAKYCHAWLKSMPCTNPSCLYLHSIGAEEDSFGKDEEAAVHTRNRVHQIVGATHNMQQRSGTTLPPPLDGPLNGSIIATDRAIARSAQKDTANATETSNGHLTCHLSSTYQNGRIKTPNKSFVDIVGRCNSGPENGNVAEDGRILNLCSELSSAAIDKDPLVSEYSDAILCKVSSSSHLPMPVPKDRDSQEYSVESFRVPSKFSILGRDDFTSSDARVTKGLSCLMSDTGKRALPGSGSDMREDLSFNDQGLKGSSSFSQGFLMPPSYHIRTSNQFNGHAWQPKETCSLPDLNVDCKTVHNHVDEASIPFTRVNSILIDGYNERKFQSPESDGSFRCSNSFSNDEIVEQLRRLDNDNITNDDDSSALDVVESSIISNILSMDCDSFDDSLTFPHGLAELFDGTDKQHGFWNFQNSDQSRFAFAKEENSVSQAIDFNSSFRNIGQVSKKYSLFSDSVTREEHYLSGPQHHVSRTQSLAPPGFSVSLTEPPPGFSTFERTNQVLSATSGSRLVKRPSLPSNQYFAPSSTGNISNARDLDLIDPAILAVGGGKATNAETRPASTRPTTFGDEGRLWPSKQQSAYKHQGSKISPTFMQETSAHQEPRFSGRIGDGFASMGDTLGISSRFMDQQESCNPSPFTQLSQQRYGNGCVSNDYWSGLDENRVANEGGMAEIPINERLGSNKLFAGYRDLMLQMPSRGGDVYNTMYGL